MNAGPAADAMRQESILRGLWQSEEVPGADERHVTFRKIRSPPQGRQRPDSAMKDLVRQIEDLQRQLLEMREQTTPLLGIHSEDRARSSIALHRQPPAKTRRLLRMRPTWSRGQGESSRPSRWKGSTMQRRTDGDLH